MTTLITKIITHLSQDYWKSVTLRQAVLREPLGLFFSFAELATENDSFHLGLFDENEKIIASLILKPINTKEIKMRQVAVDSSYQKKGYGKILVDFSEKLAKENQFDIITLHARQTAIPFYLRLQYQIEGNEFQEVNIPHFKMKKKL